MTGASPPSLAGPSELATDDGGPFHPPPQTAPFESILFPKGQPATHDEHHAQARMRDLNLDQIVASVTEGWQEYDLAPFFHAPLYDLDTVRYRQEVMRELEHAPMMEATRTFSEAMRTMRSHLRRAAKSSYKQEKERWFLNAVALYTEAVARFHERLQHLDLASRGMHAFREYLGRYLVGSYFPALVVEAATLVADLSAIRYAVVMRGRAVTVLPYEGDPDYTREVELTFEKFRRGSVRSYLVDLPRDLGLNRVEAQILTGVATLSPDVFGSLERFCERHADYLDENVARFDREVHFYVAYLAHMEKLRQTGLSFSYPRLSLTSKELYVRQAFDLALAGKVVEQEIMIVRNDLVLRGQERILVVSGPNQGGKTTFARTVGQLHYLASLGCAVPGADAQLFLPDQIFTHFEREEDIATLRGKLLDDLVRIHDILNKATTNSVVIMNEMFSSTTLRDALYLSRQIMAKVSRQDLLCVWVTFLTELASFDEKTVSVVSAIDPSDPAIRTYKVERRPADGLAYALAIAEKYKVTGRWVTERVQG